MLGDQRLDRVLSVFGVMTDNMTTPAYQALEKEWSPKLSAAYDEITLNPRLFQRIEIAQADIRLVPTADAFAAIPRLEIGGAPDLKERSVFRFNADPDAGGIDLTARRWDTSAHEAVNPLRVTPDPCLTTAADVASVTCGGAPRTVVDRDGHAPRRCRLGGGLRRGLLLAALVLEEPVVEGAVVVRGELHRGGDDVLRRRVRSRACT